MVAEEQHHHRVLLLGEVVQQVLQGLVGLFRQAQVLLGLGVLPGGLLHPHGGLEILVLVAAVVLDGDPEEEQGLSLLSVLILVDELVVGGDVAGEAVGEGAVHVEGGDVDKLVEAQVGVGGVTAPGVPVAGVHRHAAVAVAL